MRPKPLCTQITTEGGRENAYLISRLGLMTSNVFTKLNSPGSRPAQGIRLYLSNLQCVMSMAQDERTVNAGIRQTPWQAATGNVEESRIHPVCRDGPSKCRESNSLVKEEVQ